MARPELGEKRHCLSCESKFYDLNKDPATCPKCGVVFESQAPEKIEPAPKPDKTEKSQAAGSEVSNADPDTISLEDADEDDGDTVDGEDIPDVDNEEESNSNVDDAFLDEEDEDDNMSNLVNVTKDNNDET